MALAKPSVETVFLREFAETYFTEISLTISALTDREQLGIGLADVLYALKNGHVTETSKEECDGARWTVLGMTTEGVALRMRLEVWSTMYRIRLLRIGRINGV